MSKIVVFGLDGGNIKLIEQWKEELPNFKKIMEGGVFGELESTVPSLTCPAWPCMFTGKNPGKLGMYDFFSLRLSNARASRVFNSSDYYASSVWKILNDHGKSVGLLNVPMTFPPRKINGFMVCGLGTPETAATYTYPADLAKILDKIVGSYEVEPVIDLTLYGREQRYSEVSKEMLDKRLKAARYLMHNFRWDLFVCVFRVTDWVQHYFWHHMDASHPRHEATSKYKDVIKNCYKQIDAGIGELMRELSKDSNVLVVSDHGFGPIYERFLVNRWLEENGFLRFHKEGGVQRDVASNKIRDSLRILRTRFDSRLVRLIAKMVPRKLKSKLLPPSEGRIPDIFNTIDCARTKAYAVGITGGIFINLKEEGQGGPVERGREYEEVRDQIIAGLSKVVNPHTGEPADFRIFKKENIYHGPYINEAPDIALSGIKYVPVGFDDKEQWGQFASTGTHTRYGVFMACGPDVKKGGLRTKGLRIYDIAPTILHILGAPIPDDVDGRIPTEILKPGHEQARRRLTDKEAYERQKVKKRINQLKNSGKI